EPADFHPESIPSATLTRHICTPASTVSNASSLAQPTPRATATQAAKSPASGQGGRSAPASRLSSRRPQPPGACAKAAAAAQRLRQSGRSRSTLAPKRPQPLYSCPMRVSPSVRAVQVPDEDPIHPQFTSIYIVGSGQVLTIDSGEALDRYKWMLRGYLAATEHAEIALAGITHHHSDHSGNLKWAHDEMKAEIVAPKSALPLLKGR